MGERRAVSMADVARRANVSSQTVSRVSNGEPNVVESTRLTVLRAMDELGYRPNSAARALKRGEFRAIGVMTFTLSTTGNVRTLEGIVAAAATHDYAVTLIPVGAPSQDAVRGAFTRAGELAVDAVVAIMETHLASDAPAPYPPGFKVVVADSDDAGDRHPVVDTDQAAGAASATDHLLGLGHRTVWHVAGPESSFAAQRRRDAWRSRLEARGLEVPPVHHGDWTPESGYRIGLALAEEPSCTAVFAANDQMALGLLRAFHERGRPGVRGDGRALGRPGARPGGGPGADDGHDPGADAAGREVEHRPARCAGCAGTRSCLGCRHDLADLQ